ncbi:MAG: SDR family oxidoreductase [Proteobacteria bacterium]|nr:SDR family oxidoreductase [Pseudomonadota bacterium]
MRNSAGQIGPFRTSSMRGGFAPIIAMRTYQRPIVLRKATRPPYRLMSIYPRATIEETTVELWDQIMAVNLRGPFLMCRAAVPAMRAAGGGSIINVTSTNAYSGWSNLFAYSTSKGGLLVMTRNLSRGLARDRIRANALNPGWVISENEIAVQARDGHDLAWIEEAGRRQPLGRTQTPQDSAYAAVFLLSDESSQVTGTEMNVDAGRSMPGQGGSA